MENIVHFELNNWFAGRDYPDAEPFLSWMRDDLNVKFRDDDWAKENNLSIVACFVDMSQNFCVTASHKWVMENCPELLTKYRQFLRFPEEGDEDIYGQFDHRFAEYGDFGVHWIDWDVDAYYADVEES